MEESADRGIQKQADTSTENQNQSTESHKEANTSSGNENYNKRLADNIRVQVINSSSLLFGNRMTCINRVPEHIRRVNPQAYTPMVISIGPIHHFNDKLQTMEKQKAAYLMSFIARFKIDLEKFVSTIRKMEERIRFCYAKTSSCSMSSDDFVTMILLDAIFILELFLRYYTGDWDGDDPWQRNQWMLSFVRLDLVLLENQLPFFVLKELSILAFVHHSHSLPLVLHTFKFFKCFNVQKMDPEKVEIEHFTDLIRAFQQHPNPLLRRPTREKVTLRYSATELHDAGVKFVVSPSKCLLDLHYEKGVLKMPRLELDDQTEALVRNVMALEHFCHWNNVYNLTDYFIFLDSLINTIEDINLLCGRGILVNRLGDNKATFSLVKKLITDIELPDINPDFTIICEGLNKFYKKRFHRVRATLILWVTTLKNQYFNNPWRGASTIAACLLLLLTLIQTIISILQVAKA